MIEKSKRLDTDIVVRRTLINGIWKITIAKTQNDWWIKTKQMINDIIS